MMLKDSFEKAQLDVFMIDYADIITTSNVLGEEDDLNSDEGSLTDFGI